MRRARRALQFKLGAGKVIKGWEKGVRGMCVGERRKLTIPSDLAYGEQGYGDSIPAGSTLQVSALLHLTVLRTSVGHFWNHRLCPACGPGGSSSPPSSDLSQFDVELLEIIPPKQKKTKKKKKKRKVRVDENGVRPFADVMRQEVLGQRDNAMRHEKGEL